MTGFSSTVDTVGTIPGSDASSAVVSLRGLTVRLTRRSGPVMAVRGVDLQIMPGEIVGLAGESGSGKSVLAMSTIGLLPTSAKPLVEGQVETLGIDMIRGSARDRRHLLATRVGAVFQDPMTSLDPTMKVGRQIDEVSGSAAETIRLLDLVGVPEPRRRAGAYPHELSGGLRQRVMIAMAIAGSPAYLVADEPTTALDVTVQAQVLDLLRNLRNELGCSILFVTHDLAVASELADRIAVMYAGRLVEVGSTQQVLEDPLHPYSAALISSRLMLDRPVDRPLVGIPGSAPEPGTIGGQCSFAPRCGYRRPECERGEPDLVAVGTRDVRCVRVNEWRDDPTDTGMAKVDEADVVVSERDREVGSSVLTVKDVVLEVPSRRRRRPNAQILRSVSLEVTRGESVAIVGESGSGKTSLLRVISGLTESSGGLISAPGSVQMVFQDAGSSLTPWLTVGELIGERAQRAGLDVGGSVAEALRLVGLSPQIAKSRPGTLSGGQRQRVALARAIVVPPELLLCDEPTSALDVSVAATVLSLIRSLHRRLGIALVFVTHDLAAARFIADRIAVMYLGRIVELGPAEDVVGAPMHPYTRALVASLPGSLHHEPPFGEPASPFSPPTGCGFHPRCPAKIDGCESRPSQLIQIGGTHSVDCVLVGGDR